MENNIYGYIKLLNHDGCDYYNLTIFKNKIIINHVKNLKIGDEIIINLINPISKLLVNVIHNYCRVYNDKSLWSKFNEYTNVKYFINEFIMKAIKCHNKIKIDSL